MPFYATNGAVNTIGGDEFIEITESEYVSAIASMTNPSTPLLPSIAGDELSLVTPYLPDFTLPLESAVTLPVIDGGARTPVCTGLARHPDGGWLVGDDGRDDDSDPTHDAGVIYYDDSWVEQARYSLASLSIGDDQFSVQGVAVDGTTRNMWVVAKNTAGAGDTGHIIFSMSLDTETVTASYTINGEPNGIAVYPEIGEFVLLTDLGNISRWSLSDGSLLYPQKSVAYYSNPDHIYNLGGGKSLLTFGDNGSDGMVVQIDSSGQTPIREREFTLTGSDAIEGVVVYDGKIYVCNDAEFHSGEPELNRVLIYDASGLF